MTGSSLRRLAGKSAVLCLLASVGCSGSKSDSIPDSAHTKPSETQKAVTPKSKDEKTKLLADMPTPLGAVVISGEQSGYLEPCGCTQGQLGGLARRYDFIEKLKAQGWPIAQVDLGGLAGDPAKSPGGLEQTRIKFDVALKAYAALKVDAVGFLVNDLKLGVMESIGQLTNLGDFPRFVSANASVLDDLKTAKNEPLVSRFLVVNAGKYKIGVTSVLDPETYTSLNDPAKTDLLTIKQPQEALKAILEEMEKASDRQILLVQGTVAQAKALAQTFPSFEMVVATSTVDPEAQPEMLNGGKTALITVGPKGKYVGVFGLYDDDKKPMRYQRVTLNSRFKMAEPIAKLINEEYQSTLKAQGIVENFPKRGNAKAAQGSTYIGSESCKNCHPNTYAKWATTKHALAFDSITHDPRGDRRYDAECISCHTTGFEFVSGYVSSEKTPYLQGNGCENCHGPGSKHAADPDEPSFRKALALTSDIAKTSVCMQCHDEENSHNFDFMTYYGKVIHKGMDTYTDPKVHQGQPSRVASKP